MVLTCDAYGLSWPRVAPRPIPSSEGTRPKFRHFGSRPKPHRPQGLPLRRLQGRTTPLRVRPEDLPSHRRARGDSPRSDLVYLARPHTAKQSHRQPSLARSRSRAGEQARQEAAIQAGQRPPDKLGSMPALDIKDARQRAGLLAGQRAQPTAQPTIPQTMRLTARLTVQRTG